MYENRSNFRGERMRNIGHIFVLMLAIVWPFAGLSRAQEAPYRVNDDEVKGVLARLEKGADNFRKSLKDALGKSRFDDTSAEGNINQYVKDFEVATDRLKKNFDD